MMKRNLLRNTAVETAFNKDAFLPYELRLDDFKIAMQDVYDFFYDVNNSLLNKGLRRLEDTLRPAILSGILSDIITSSMAKHARTLTENQFFNGHPDLIVNGIYPNNSIKSGEEGVEIKATNKSGGAVDTHGAREQFLCVWVYRIDKITEPAINRTPLTFSEIYLNKVEISDFRRNERGVLGTRTATLHREGIKKLRENWIYMIDDQS